MRVSAPEVQRPKMSKNREKTVMRCPNGCCPITIGLYRPRRKRHGHRRREKAGVFVFDPGSDTREPRVLLVQSRGHLWGAPKGTAEEGESVLECALREVKEETGLSVDPELFAKSTRVKGVATYFYAEIERCDVAPDTTMQDNDVNGIAWIRLSCLGPCLREGQLILNRHCKILLRRFLGLSFPESEFVRMRRKRQGRSRAHCTSRKENNPSEEVEGSVKWTRALPSPLPSLLPRPPPSASR